MNEICPSDDLLIDDGIVVNSSDDDDEFEMQLERMRQREAKVGPAADHTKPILVKSHYTFSDSSNRTVEDTIPIQETPIQTLFQGEQIEKPVEFIQDEQDNTITGSKGSEDEKVFRQTVQTHEERINGIGSVANMKRKTSVHPGVYEDSEGSNDPKATITTEEISPNSESSLKKFTKRFFTFGKPGAVKEPETLATDTFDKSVDNIHKREDEIDSAVKIKNKMYEKTNRSKSTIPKIIPDHPKVHDNSSSNDDDDNHSFEEYYGEDRIVPGINIKISSRKRDQQKQRSTMEADTAPVVFDGVAAAALFEANNIVKGQKDTCSDENLLTNDIDTKIIDENEDILISSTNNHSVGHYKQKKSRAQKTDFGLNRKDQKTEEKSKQTSYVEQDGGIVLTSLNDDTDEDEFMKKVQEKRQKSVVRITKSPRRKNRSNTKRTSAALPGIFTGEAVDDVVKDSKTEQDIDDEEKDFEPISSGSILFRPRSDPPDLFESAIRFQMQSDEKNTHTVPISPIVASNRRVDKKADPPAEHEHEDSFNQFHDDPVTISPHVRDVEKEKVSPTPSSGSPFLRFAKFFGFGISTDQLNAPGLENYKPDPPDDNDNPIGISSFVGAANDDFPEQIEQDQFNINTSAVTDVEQTSQHNTSTENRADVSDPIIKNRKLEKEAKITDSFPNFPMQAVERNLEGEEEIESSSLCGKIISFDEEDMDIEAQHKNVDFESDDHDSLKDVLSLISKLSDDKQNYEKADFRTQEKQENIDEENRFSSNDPSPRTSDMKPEKSKSMDKPKRRSLGYIGLAVFLVTLAAVLVFVWLYFLQGDQSGKGSVTITEGDQGLWSTSAPATTVVPLPSYEGPCGYIFVSITSAPSVPGNTDALSSHNVKCGIIDSTIASAPSVPVKTDALLRTSDSGFPHRLLL